MTKLLFMVTEMKNYNAILIGNGTMGKRHRSRFESCGVRFVQVLDLDASDWIGSARDLPKADFVVIASPASTHYEYAKFFLERRIPVLVEKPLATTAAQASELVALAQDNGTLLFVAQSECYNPIFLNFRKHLLVDLRNARKSAFPLPLKVKLEFRREHGFSERCRDVDVALDLLVHDVSLFLNLFDAKDVVIVDDGRSCSCGCSGDSCGCGDRIHMSLKVVAGEFAGVEADFVADRSSERDSRLISVDFGKNGNMPGFDYSVSLVHYTKEGAVAHIPDSLDNEHRFFLKLLAGACGDWAYRAMMNAANAVIIATGESPVV